MKSHIIGAGLAWAMLGQAPALADAPAAHAHAPAAPAPAAPAAHAAAGPAFVPRDFAVPVAAEGPGFKLVPLGPALVKIDFDAYMSSVAHLQTTFSRSRAWPHAGISAADALRDMENEQGRFRDRKSFAYAVLTPDGTRERGSVYVRPSSLGSYDAVVAMWVTKAEYDAGFDAELYRWVTAWVQKDWPFRHVAYPGRAIAWGTWDALAAAGKAKAGTPAR